MVDEAHRTQSDREESLAGQLRGALPNARYFGMTGTPVRSLATDTFALFGDAADPGRVLLPGTQRRGRSLDEATGPGHAGPAPGRVRDGRRGAAGGEFDQFADDFGLDDPDRETLSRKFGRLTSVFSNPDRVRAVFAGTFRATTWPAAYRNGLKAQVVAFSRELAVTYTDTINELLALRRGVPGARRGRAARAGHRRGEHLRLRRQGRGPRHAALPDDGDAGGGAEVRFLTPDDPLCFPVVTAKLMTGFDAPNEGVLSPSDKPMKAHTLFQAITRPNRTWISLSGYTKTTGVVVDYIGLAEEVQRSAPSPTPPQARKRRRRRRAAGSSPTCPTWSPSSAPPSPASRTSWLLLSMTWTLTVHGYASPSGPSAPSSTPTPPPLRGSPGTTGCWPGCTRTSAPTPAQPSTATGSGCSGRCTRPCSRSPPTRNARSGWPKLGPMVLEIINAHVHSFTAVASQEEPLVLDAQGISILKELLALVRPKASPGGEVKAPSAAEILDAIKAALDEGVEPGSAKYTALAERLRQLRNRIIQNAQDALDFLAEALKVARTVVDAARNPDQAVVMDEDHVGVLSRIIRDHAPEGLTVTERNLAEEIDQVVQQTLARPWDNADARSRGVRRATAAVFRRYSLKPVGEPYDSTVAYIEAHYLVD